MVSYLILAGTKLKQTGDWSLAHLNSLSDVQLIEAYKGTYVLLNMKLPGIQGPVAAAKNALQDTSLGHFLGALSNGATWVRVAEFAVGGVLLAIGVNAFLKQSVGTDAGGAVKKVGGALPPLRAASTARKLTEQKAHTAGLVNYHASYGRQAGQQAARGLT